MAFLLLFLSLFLLLMSVYWAASLLADQQLPESLQHPVEGGAATEPRLQAEYGVVGGSVRRGGVE